MGTLLLKVIQFICFNKVSGHFASFTCQFKKQIFLIRELSINRIIAKICTPSTSHKFCEQNAVVASSMFLTQSCTDTYSNI